MRECGSCQKCCEGHLHGVAHGYTFWKSRKCHFLNKTGCSIYPTRPDNPCKSYKCMWLGDDNFPLDKDTIPAWMKPDEVNAILTWRKIGDIEYFELIEAGEILRADVLSWAIQYALNNNLNINYQINGGWNQIGSPEFLEIKF